MSHDYFFCYNSKLSQYIKSKGIQPIVIARELKENKLFSLYSQTAELSQAIKEYKTTKH
jgi:hypothetical protein